jgi:hypothetical protein
MASHSYRLEVWEVYSIWDTARTTPGFVETFIRLETRFELDRCQKSRANPTFDAQRYDAGEPKYRQLDPSQKIASHLVHRSPTMLAAFCPVPASYLTAACARLY